MKDKFDINKIKGWLIIWGIDKDGKREKLYDNHNTLTNDAKQILTKMLAGDPWSINNITCLKANGILAANTNLSHTYPTTDSVQFSCTFSETDFNDTLDEIQLISQGGLIFSHVVGLAVYKPNTLKLQITWKLTIN